MNTESTETTPTMNTETTNATALPAQSEIPEAYRQVTFAFEYVTPAMAARWLETINSMNRKINKRAIKRLASDMQAGKFLTTHQGIAFDAQGGLLDGQHRLKAIVTSGVPCQLLVSRGWPITVNFDDGTESPTFMAFDTPGNNRTTKMFLHSMGVENETKIAALCIGFAHFTEPFLGSVMLTNWGISSVFQRVKPTAIRIAQLAEVRGIVKIPVAALWSFAWAHTVYPEITEKLLADTIQASGEETSLSRKLAFAYQQMPVGGGNKAKWKRIAMAASAIQSQVAGEKLEHIKGNKAAYLWLQSQNKALRNELSAFLTMDVGSEAASSKP
jgi:hypothetical protein